MSFIEVQKMPERSLGGRANPSLSFLRRILKKSSLDITPETIKSPNFSRGESGIGWELSSSGRMSHFAKKIASYTTPNITVTNTTTETRVFRFILPGGLLGSNNVLWIRMLGISVAGDGVAQLTMRPKFGGTLVSKIVTPANATHNGSWDFYIVGDGDPATIKFWDTILLSPEQNVTSNAALTFWRNIPASAGRNTNVDQEVEFTVQWDTASTSLTFGLSMAFALLFSG